MTFAIPDDLSSPIGLLDIWDTTVQFDSDKAFLADNKHVDVRSFRSGGTRPVLLSEVEGFDPIEGDVLLDLEEAEIASTESWVLTGTGLSSTLAVGAIAARNNWSGLQTTTT